jgi:hypothetical protein
MPCDRELELSGFTQIPAEEVIAAPPDPPGADGIPSVEWIAWTLRPDVKWAMSLDDGPHEEQHKATNKAVEWSLYVLQTEGYLGMLGGEDDEWLMKFADLVVRRRKQKNPVAFGEILTPKQRKAAQKNPRTGKARITMYARELAEYTRALKENRVRELRERRRANFRMPTPHPIPEERPVEVETKEKAPAELLAEFAKVSKQMADAAQR